ncbi:hypothetical protein Hsw_3676 [Hymenobacter swuensis DY53]|uniref:Uncharacterized protein n=1 Tax=Hymenobacter swuensis DY53 TaxID=1227739 RepID=W8F9E3_9BACT|nr:hypothetical protein Hsw_3676 [Hymenobacter swuensis DY53]
MVFRQKLLTKEKNFAVASESDPGTSRFACKNYFFTVF